VDNIQTIGFTGDFTLPLTSALFFFFWLCWVFVAARRLSLVAAAGGYSLVVGHGLIAVASLVAEHGF